MRWFQELLVRIVNGWKKLNILNPTMDLWGMKLQGKEQ